MNANPFANRGPVLDPSEFFGRRRELRDILSGVLRPGSCCNVYGEPRIGRTSLLRYIEHQAGVRTDPDVWPFGDRAVVTVYVALDPSVDASADAFWRQLYASWELARSTDSASGTARDIVQGAIDWRADGGATAIDEGLDASRALWTAVQEDGRPTIFLVDDFEHYARALGPRALTDVATALRRHVDAGGPDRYVLATCDNLGSLLRAHALSGPDMSRLANRTLLAGLGLMTDAEAEALLITPRGAYTSSERMGIETAQEIIPIAGAHPDLLKVAAMAWLELGDVAAVASRVRLDRYDLMQLWWERLDPPSGDEAMLGIDMRAALRAVAEGRPTGQAAALNELRQRGFVVPANGGYRVFASVFGDFVRERAEQEHRVAASRPSRGGRGPARSGEEVRIRGAAVNLTDQEAALFRLLQANAGQAVSRADLFAEIWGASLPSEPREAKRATDRLDKLVGRLRAKIEARPDSPTTLITVRGFGYMLQPEPASS